MMLAERTEVYENNDLKFYLLPEKTIVANKYQVFMLVPVRHIYTKRLERLRDKIRKQRVYSFSDIVSHCEFKPGKKGQMLGIEIINTKLERHVSV